MAGGSGVVNQAASAGQGTGGMPQSSGVFGQAMQRINSQLQPQPVQQPTGLFGGNFPQPNTTPGQQAPAAGFGNLANVSLAMPYEQPQQSLGGFGFPTPAPAINPLSNDAMKQQFLAQQGIIQPMPAQQSPYQQLAQQGSMEQMARQKAVEQMLGQQQVKPAGGLDALAQAQSQLMAQQQPAAPSPSASMQQPQPARSPFGGFRRRRM